MAADPPMRLWFDRSPIGMFSASQDGRIYDVNPALARMLGYEADELLAKNLTFDIYVDPAERAALHAASWDRGTCDGACVHWRHRDGRTVTIQLWGHIVKTETPPRFEAWAIDVTEQEASVQALRRQREELERTTTILDLVLRQIPAIYWMLDHDLRVVRSGGAIEHVLGFSQDRYVGRSIDDIYDPSPGASHEPWTFDPRKLYADALRGQSAQYETEFHGKLMASTVRPYRGDDGEIQGVIGTSIDVTHVRQLERRMIDAQRAESLGVLAGGLAHDFNNLLVAVIGNAELALRDLPAGAGARGAIENIRDAGLRAAELTEQLLAYAGRGGAGTTRVLAAPLVEELLRIVAPTMPEGVRSSVEIPRELELRGDPAQVRQVVLNLIGNARDALGGQGHIAITARVIDHPGGAYPDDVLSAAQGRYACLEVADDGPGMDAETRRRVFEPFFTTKASGHGLGLAAVLGIVRAHRGGIRLTTSPGAGTRFSILWPVPGPEPQAAAEPAVGARTVLVVDDEGLVRDVVAQMIRDLGYAAITAADGRTALEMLRHHAVDAVLIDLSMPGMSGAEVVNELRRERPRLPIVLCSGYDRDGRGPVTADAYLPKPFRIEALERTLAKVLPLRSV